MVQASGKMGSGGRLVVPAEVRRALAMKQGDTFVFVANDDGLLVLTPEQAVRRAQALVAAYVSGDPSLSEELIAERREQADAE